MQILPLLLIAVNVKGRVMFKFNLHALKARCTFFPATAVSHFKSGKLLDVAKNSIIDSQVKSCFKNFSQRITFTNCCLFCRENTTADLEFSLASTLKKVCRSNHIDIIML